MIDTKELRIGNWVACPELKMIAQVDIIGTKKVCLDFDPFYHGEKTCGKSTQELLDVKCDFFAEKIEGVLLFKDLLINTGFGFQDIKEEDASWWEFLMETELMNIELLFDGEYYCWLTQWVKPQGFQQSGMVKIKYLHQLQNLYFSLTNKELEIKFPAKTVPA